MGRMLKWPGRRRSAWAVILVWVAVVAASGSLSGKLGSVQKNDASQWLPHNAESTRVAAVAGQFSPDDVFPAVVVYDRGGALMTETDRARAASDATAFAKIGKVVAPITGPTLSQDKKALETIVPVRVGVAGLTDVLPAVKAIRAQVAGEPARVHVTGPAGYGADSTDAFSGLSSTLLYVTLGIVTAVLLITYRSPFLWILPLVCVGIALLVAQAVIYLLAAHAGVTVNSDSTFLLTVLVFGAGTDYALLLVARYREELRRHADRFAAMRTALRRSGPAILASGVTVVLSLLCLTAADLNSTKGLGPVMAAGVAVGLVAMLTLFPAVLVLCGYWVFWPRRPRYGDSDPRDGRVWERTGRWIARRPRAVWLTTAVVLVALAFGLVGLKANGLENKDSFRSATEAVTGEQILGEHFAASSGDPLQIVGPAGAAQQLFTVASATPGIDAVSQPRTAGGHAYLEATPAAVSDSAAAYQTVDRLRAAVHRVAGSEVGGGSAINLDTIRASRRDRSVVVPLVLVVVFLILCLLLRALVAPLVLLATVVLSLAAGIGISALVFDHLFGFAGSDAAFPLWAFVFLVALGIDYNIFLMTRVREDAARVDTRRAAISALRSTGGTITSAGVVLAGTFAALTTLPLVFAVEIGFVVAFGVLLDTFVVRSVLVTALTVDLGDRMWWPNRPRAGHPGQPDSGIRDRMNASAS
jgi:RND superfamily putative drug exporter